MDSNFQLDGDIVAACVTWLDTAAYPGWHGSQDAAPIGPMEVKSLGWLISQDSISVVLAMSSSLYKIGDLLVIPTQSIIAVDILPSKKDGS